MTNTKAGTNSEAETLKSKAAKGFMWGGLNNGLVQVISALFGIILLRWLCPEDYGKIAMLMVFADIASTLQESGFTAALCNLKEPSHRDYNAVFWFNILVSALLYVVLFFTAPLIARFYDDLDFIPLARYLFLGFFVSSWGTVQRAYLFIHLMQKESCIIAITSVIGSNSIGVLMVYMGYSYWGLATQKIAFILIVALMNWYYSPWRPTFDIDLRPAWKMFSFSWKLLLTNIVNSLSSNAFSFLLGKYYGKHLTGVYSNARKWDDMCSNTINGMLTGVAQPVLTQVREDMDRYRMVFRKMLRFISFISFPCLLGMGLIAREFIVIVVGPKWIESAALLSMLCFYGAIWPLLTLYSQMTISQGRSNINMWCTICLSALILTGLVLLYPLGIYAMVAYFVSINVLWLFVWQYFAWRLIRLRLWDALRDVLPFFFISVAVMGGTWWLTQSIQNTWLLLISKIITAIVLYSGIMWISGARIMQESIQFLRGKANI